MELVDQFSKHLTIMCGFSLTISAFIAKFEFVHHCLYTGSLMKESGGTKQLYILLWQNEADQTY